jgi:PAS domain-containing protein
MRLPGIFIKALTVSGTMTGAGGGLSRGPGNMDVLPYDIIEFYPDPTLVIDNDGMVIAWNKAIEDMTGVSAKEVIGKGDYEYSLAFYGYRRPILIDLLDFPVDRVKAMYNEVRIADGKLEAMTESVRLKGSEVVLWCISSKLYGHDGKAVGAIESIRDVTGQVRTERELKKARTELEMRVESAPPSLRGAQHPAGDAGHYPCRVVMAREQQAHLLCHKSAVDIFSNEMVGLTSARMTGLSGSEIERVAAGA